MYQHVTLQPAFGASHGNQRAEKKVFKRGGKATMWRGKTSRVEAVSGGLEG